jgi:hypothetical protein
VYRVGFSNVHRRAEGLLRSWRRGRAENGNSNSCGLGDAGSGLAEGGDRPQTFYQYGVIGPRSFINMVREALALFSIWGDACSRACERVLSEEAVAGWRGGGACNRNSPETVCCSRWRIGP